MGLFGNAKPNPSEALNPQRAMMTLLVATIFSDGDIEEEEYRLLKSICARSPIFSSNTQEEYDRLIKFACEMLNTEEPIVAAAKHLPSQLRETAFALATDLVLADGIVSNDEESFLEDLGVKLGVKEQDMKAMIYTTLVRNRGL